MRSEAAWSYLDPKPICLYDPKYDAHLAYWNGIAMTRTYALMIYSTTWLQIYPTDTQRQAAFDEYNRIYRMGGFGTRAWDTQIGNRSYHGFYNYLASLICKKDSKFLTNLKEQYHAKQALGWFMPGKELVDHTEKS